MSHSSTKGRQAIRDMILIDIFSDLAVKVCRQVKKIDSGEIFGQSPVSKVANQLFSAETSLHVVLHYV